MTRKHSPRIALLLFTLGIACTGDDDGDDGATTPSTADDSPTTSSSSSTGDDTDASSSSDEGGDSGTTGEFGCGPVETPQYCIDYAAHIIECDPESAEFEDELISECACDHDELNQTDECLAALDLYVACFLATPCEELVEASCQAEADAAEAPCSV